MLADEHVGGAVDLEVGNQIQTSEHYGVASIRTTVWIEATAMMNKARPTTAKVSLKRRVL